MGIKLKKKGNMKAMTGEKPKSISIFWLCAAVKRVADDAQDYAHMDSSTQVWVKAARKDAAVALARRQLAAEGWQLNKVYMASKVTPGFARMGSMVDPPAFTEEEADEWTEQYHVAAAEGFSCLFIFWDKAEPRKPERGHR